VTIYLEDLFRGDRYRCPNCSSNRLDCICDWADLINDPINKSYNPDFWNGNADQ